MTLATPHLNSRIRGSRKRSRISPAWVSLTNGTVRQGSKLNEQIDWHLEELSQPSRLGLADGSPSAQHFGAAPLLPSTGQMSLCLSPRSCMRAFNDSLGETRGKG